MHALPASRHGPPGKRQAPGPNAAQSTASAAGSLPRLARSRRFVYLYAFATENTTFVMPFYAAPVILTSARMAAGMTSRARRPERSFRAG